MPPTTAIATCFRRYATFSGRSGRAELWWFLLLAAVLHAAFTAVLLGLSVRALSGGDGAPGTALDAALTISHGAYLLVALTFLVPMLAVMWRRLHDTGRTGGWCLLLLVPGLGVLVLLVLWALEGTAGPNRFGASPQEQSPWATR